jgi:DHA2 family multidrug resistance protein
MLSVALFTASSFMCGVAPNLGALILARVLQGAAGAGLQAVEQSMIVDTFAPSQRGAAFALYGLVVIIGPIVGPVLGGIITDNASWRWCFLINVPVGALSLFLVDIFVDEPLALIRDRIDRLRRGLRVDVVGFILVALFFGCLELTLDRGQTDDWFSSPAIVTTTVIAALSFALFIPWELTRKEPIVPIAMFGRRNFAVASIFLLLTGMILFGTTLFIPQLLQVVLGYTATNAGFALTAGGLATIVAMPIVGMLSSRVDARLLVLFGFVIQGLALINLSHLNTSMSFADAAWARVFQAVGLPFLFVPISMIAYVGLKPDESNQASAMMNVARNLGGTIGISGVQTLLVQRTQWHQARLVESLNPLNPDYTQWLNNAVGQLMGFGHSAMDSQALAVASLYREVGRQAQMLAYIDVFHILMIVVFACLPLLLLMHGSDAAPSAEAGH